MSTEAKVGSFVLVGLVLMGLAVFLLGDVTFESRYRVYVDFTSVSGLPDRAVVKLSGVDVGDVETIRLREDGVRVELGIREGVEIYRDSKFRIGSTSIIGSKFLEIEQGTRLSGVLAPNSVVRGEDVQDLQRSLVQTLDRVQLLLDDVRGEGQLGRNLNAAVDNLRELTLTMNELLAETKPALSASMQRMDEITMKLDSILAKADQMMSNVNSSTGTVGALLTDKEMKDDVKATISELRQTATSAKNVLGRVGSYRLFWHYNNRHEFDSGISRSDGGIRLYPREGRYYYFGISNALRSENALPGINFEDTNTIDAYLGWDWTDFNLYTGIVRGNGGFGAEYRPFSHTPFLDKMWFQAQGHDFLRDRVISGRRFDQPQYDVGIRYQPHRLVAVGVRLEDVLEKERVQTQLRVTFEDKDLAYLFGLAVSGSGVIR